MLHDPLSSPRRGPMRPDRRVRGRPAAFAGVFDRHWPRIHRYCVSRAGAAGEDIAAETFRVAFDERDRSTRARTMRRPWLYGIATTWCGAGAGAPPAAARVAGAVEGDSPTALDRVEARRARPRAGRRAAPVSAADRDALLLHAWAELTYGRSRGDASRSAPSAPASTAPASGCATTLTWEERLRRTTSPGLCERRRGRRPDVAGRRARRARLAPRSHARAARARGRRARLRGGAVAGRAAAAPPPGCRRGGTAARSRRSPAPLCGSRPASRPRPRRRRRDARLAPTIPGREARFTGNDLYLDDGRYYYGMTRRAAGLDDTDRTRRQDSETSRASGAAPRLPPAEARGG